jgi:hypothetical protein
MKIDEITAWAKELLLEDGTHAPTLFVETDAPEVIISELADLPPTPNARLSYFLELGRHLARKHPNEQAREVAFIALSWASKQAPDQPVPEYRPSQDPNRMELLVISHLTLRADFTTRLDGQLVEIIRDNEGKVRDLYQLPGNVESGESAMLVLFILGFQYPEMTELEFKQIMLRTFGV